MVPALTARSIRNRESGCGFGERAMWAVHDPGVTKLHAAVQTTRRSDAPACRRTAGERLRLIPDGGATTNESRTEGFYSSLLRLSRDRRVARVPIGPCDNATTVRLSQWRRKIRRKRQPFGHKELTHSEQGLVAWCPGASQSLSHALSVYGHACNASTRRRRRIAHFSGSRSFASNRFQTLRVNRSSAGRPIRSTSPHQHCTTTAGAGDLCSLGSGRTGRGRSSRVRFGGDRRMREHLPRSSPRYSQRCDLVQGARGWSVTSALRGIPRYA